MKKFPINTLIIIEMVIKEIKIITIFFIVKKIFSSFNSLILIILKKTLLKFIINLPFSALFPYSSW